MGRREKLVDRFLRLPKDFTFDEVVTLQGYFNYHIDNKGSTSGSRVAFVNGQTGDSINLHRPHPGAIMKEWMMKQLYLHLKLNGLI